MLTAHEIMRTNVATVEPTCNLETAINLVLNENLDVLYVVDENQRLIGKLSESSLLSAAFDPHFRLNPVSLHMQRDFLSVRGSDSVEFIAEQFVLHRQSELPVVQNETLIGSVTRKDLIRSVIGKQGETPFF